MDSRIISLEAQIALLRSSLLALLIAADRVDRMKPGYTAELLNAREEARQTLEQTKPR